jgi:uncharacterized membrane protein
MMHINKFIDFIKKYINNIFLAPFLIYVGVKKIFFPINILLIFLGVFITYNGNKKYENKKTYNNLFDILILGPLLFIIGYTKNRYIHLKNLLSVIGFCIILYRFKYIFINVF